METEVYDYPLLNYPSLMLVVLRRAASGEASLADCFDCLEAALRGAGERLCAPETEVRERLARART